MEYTVFDIETDGLELEKITKIHCLAYTKYKNFEILEKRVITEDKDIKDFILKQKVIVGHNIIRYDIPVLNYFFNINIQAVLIDTLAISWYLYPIKGFKHNLENFGNKYGIKKIEVSEDKWKTSDIELFKKRCIRDVEINSKLFHNQINYLQAIYQDKDKILRLIKYLSFKFKLLYDQESSGINLDIELIEKSQFNLEILMSDKIDALREKMPKELGKIKKKKPKNCFNKKGLSYYGKKWFSLLKEYNLPEDTEIIRELPNPGSSQQLKEWLFMLDWKPETFKLNVHNDKIPQISLPFGQGICNSVKKLYKDYPYLENLEQLYKIRHRLGIFKNFLKHKNKNNKVYMTAHGFTNTLRLQHASPIVNLPKPGTFYGNEIRGSLTVFNNNYIMIGADISGLEDNTKQHYIYFFDPKYVTDMRVPGFDPHLDIGLLSGILTKKEVDFYKSFHTINNPSAEEILKFKQIRKKRSTAKTVNFSATYGAGPKKMSESLKCTLKEAKTLHSAYWQRNKAIKQVARNCKIKTVNNQKWLYNPVSKLWYFLKAEKDKFSTLNQSTGVYVFDTWAYFAKKELDKIGIKICLQYHDEMLLILKKDKKDIVIDILKNAMKEVNKYLKLNVEIDISIDIGNNYKECH